MVSSPSVDRVSPASSVPDPHRLSGEKLVLADDQILVTGASGFIGARVVASVLALGYRRIRCFTRPSSNLRALNAVIATAGDARVEVISGNLLSPADCAAAAKGAKVILHLASGTGTRSYADAFLNAVVTTRNLLDAVVAQGVIRRFVNVSSFAVYTNRHKHSSVLDETCPEEPNAAHCGEPYCFAKVRQDDIVREYGKKHGLPYVMIRPGVVYGAGKYNITGRIGLGTFGLFLHLGGGNPIPFTYVENCADAIALAGVIPGVDGETFNVVDDDIPSSRGFLRLYKHRVKSFPSLLIPRPVSYVLCWMWEKLAARSRDQLPEFVNLRAWHAYWKGSKYSNAKIKRMLGWKQRIPTSAAMRLFLENCRKHLHHA